MLNQNNELNELDAESSPANTTAHHLFQNSNFTNDSKRAVILSQLLSDVSSLVHF